MEDYQEQEYEFWRRLDEEQLDRRKLLKRGLAAGAGLTIFSLSDVALATRQRVLADPPLRGTPGTMKELVAQAKKEGHLNDIALPDDWANYGGIIKTFQKKYGITVLARQPGRHLGAGEPGDRVAQGRSPGARRRRCHRGDCARRSQGGPLRPVLRPQRTRPSRGR